MFDLRIGNMSCETCNQCGKTLSCKQVLHRHGKICKASGKRCPDGSAAPYQVNDFNLKIGKKKVGEKQPQCNEIIHFSINEFKDGKSTSLETLNKITELVNSELLPLLSVEKKIGMGINTILAAPTIGFVDASISGVPGHPLHNNELIDILKPIRPASIKSPQTVEKTAENTQECKSNCNYKNKEG